MSKIKQTLGRVIEAIYYLKLSIQLYQGEKDGLALRYQSLANFYMASVDYAMAEEYYLQAAQLFQQLEEKTKLSDVFRVLASLYELQGKEKEALLYYQKSAGEVCEGALAVEAILEIAGYYERKKKWLDALKTYWRALQIARESQIKTIGIELGIQRISNKLRQKVKYR